MRTLRTIYGLAVGAILLFGLAFLLFPRFHSRYLRFMAKNPAYYSEVAHACDLVMQQHPVSSNDTVALYRDMTLTYTTKLSGQEVSLPKIIRALHPDMILVSTNRVWIVIPEMGGFGLTWEQDESRNGYWTLQSHAEGLTKTVYEERKP